MPKKETESDKIHNMNWRGLLKYILNDETGKFVLALSLSLLTNVFFYSINPLALKYLFDAGIITGNFQLFIIIGIGLGLVFTIWRLWVYGTRMFVQQLKVIVAKNLCIKLLTKYYQIPYEKIIKKEQGYFVSRVYDEAVKTANPTIDTSLYLFDSIIALAVSAGIAFWVSWRASIAVLIAIPVIYLLSYRYSSKIKVQTKIENEEEAKLRGLMTQSINSYKAANIYNLKAKVFEKISKYYDVYSEAFTSRVRISIKYEMFNRTLVSYVGTLAMVAAGYEILVGRITFGDYMAFMNTYLTSVRSVQSIFTLMPEISRLCGAAERLEEFGEDDVRQDNLTYSVNEVNLEQVNFGYNEKPVIENANFKFALGEKILIVGSNGTGKSTLAHLISGLFFPSSGNLKTFDLSRVSAVIYPTDFVPGSVRDNFSFAVSKDEKERLKKLSEKFSLEDFLDKEISKLSTGQRKKIEVIMALVKDSDIYIFDEPLAGIDLKSKQKVMDEIFRFTEGKLLLVIMHGDEIFYSRFNRTINLKNSN